MLKFWVLWARFIRKLINFIIIRLSRAESHAYEKVESLLKKQGDLPKNYRGYSTENGGYQTCRCGDCWRYYVDDMIETAFRK